MTVGGAERVSQGGRIASSWREELKHRMRGQRGEMINKHIEPGECDVWRCVEGGRESGEVVRGQVSCAAPSEFPPGPQNQNLSSTPKPGE